MIRRLWAATLGVVTLSGCATVPPAGQPVAFSQSPDRVKDCFLTIAPGVVASPYQGGYRLILPALPLTQIDIMPSPTGATALATSKLGATRSFRATLARCKIQLDGSKG